MRNTPASQRAVLEFLAERQSHTVPQIAQALSVSRQHIQVLVNDLQALGLVQASDNSAHKRSPLIGISPAGHRLFRSIHNKELRLLESLQQHFSHKDLTTTLEALKSLDELLTTEFREESGR